MKKLGIANYEKEILATCNFDCIQKLRIGRAVLEKNQVLIKVEKLNFDFSEGHKLCCQK